MSEAIIQFFQGLSLSDELLVTIVSMIPIVELRGAIPLGFVLGMDPWVLYALTVLGNLLPVPFILLLIRPVIRWFLKTRAFRKLGLWIEAKAEKHKGKVEKYEFWGLFIFVAIPLPGTGAWTGALIAAFLDMRMKKALPSIALGVLTAGLIMTFGSSIVAFIVSLF
ncbi:MAG: small multi-drug export protein [Clostridia bacterium]|nr:small multi-drug export protein [Clostridia bacterium]